MKSLRWQIAALGALAAACAHADGVPSISLLRKAPSDFQARLTSPPLSAGRGAAGSTRFNAEGNLLIGRAGHAGGIGGADLLLEVAADGTTAWECRLAPGGSLTGFARGTDGVTLVVQYISGRTSRVLALDRRGSFLRGWAVRADGDEPPPPVITVQSAPAGGLIASVPGYAFSISRRGSLTMEWSFGKLKSAIALADGRWLAALSRPERFALYDPRSRALTPLPLDGFCHVWGADRAEELGPDRFRLFGCFCMSPGPATDTQVRPRVTIEVADTDAGGRLIDTYGSPHALRVDEFGTERCATFTRGLIRTPDGGTVVVNTYPADCRVEVRNAAGTVIRTLFAATAGIGGTFGEEACALIGIQRIGGAAPRPGAPPPTAGGAAGGEGTISTP